MLVSACLGHGVGCKATRRAFYTRSHAHLQIAVFDHDPLSKDDLVGDVDLDLSNVFQFGVREAWAPLRNGATGVDAGEVHIRAEFHGVPGVAFPQLCSREWIVPVMSIAPVASASLVVEKGLDVKPVIRDPGDAASTVAALTSPLPTSPRRRRAAQDDDDDYDTADQDFTDDQIKAAFGEIDLDHNSVIGFAELRHMLICMGELVTPEEVDEMIRLISTTGNSVCTYHEFYAMARHPNPGGTKFDPTTVVNRLKVQEKSSHASATRSDTLTAAGAGALTLAAADVKRAKFRASQRFAAVHCLRLSDLVSITSHATRLEPFFQRANGRVTLPEMAKVSLTSVTCTACTGQSSTWCDSHVVRYVRAHTATHAYTFLGIHLSH